MSDRASIKDVAAAARVSIKTVSRVLNDVSTVDPAMRRRVERAIAALDYSPSPTARSLRTGNTALVGVVVDAIDDPFFAALVAAIEDCALNAGLDILVASTRFDAARQQVQLTRMLGQRPRGIILAPVGPDFDFLRERRGSVPVVVVDRPAEGFESVVTDDYPAARHGVDLLLAHGHARVAFLGYDPRFPTSRTRRDAYEDALAAAHLPIDPLLVPDVPMASTAARAALEQVLALPNPPTAVFVANGRHAAPLVSAMHDLDRTDLALVSFGDFPLAAALNPTVTCINQDPHRMGVLAFERMLAMADDPHPTPSTRIVPTQLIKRGSHALAPRMRLHGTAAARQ